MAGPKTKKDKDGLTPLDRAFAMQFLVDLNAANAYIRARHPVKVSRATANTNSWKLMKRPGVQALISAHRDKAMAKAELSVEQTLDKLRQFLMYDPRKLFDEQGKQLPLHMLPDDLAAACVGYKDTIAGREIKLVDKVSALDKAMKYHGLFEKDNKQTADAITEVMFSFMSPGGKVEPASG